MDNLNDQNPQNSSNGPIWTDQVPEGKLNNNKPISNKPEAQNETDQGAEGISKEEQGKGLGVPAKDSNTIYPNLEKKKNLKSDSKGNSKKKTKELLEKANTPKKSKFPNLTSGIINHFIESIKTGMDATSNYRGSAERSNNEGETELEKASKQPWKPQRSQLFGAIAHYAETILGHSPEPHPDHKRRETNPVNTSQQEELSRNSQEQATRTKNQAQQRNQKIKENNKHNYRDLKQKTADNKSKKTELEKEIIEKHYKNWGEEHKKQIYKTLDQETSELKNQNLSPSQGNSSEISPQVTPRQTPLKVGQNERSF